MFFPAEMTALEIMNFEYEINKLIDTERGEGQFWAENAECQVVADEQREAFLALQDAGYFGV